MAATDQTYRNQRTVDIVFGASCVLMLAAIVWMFAQDYFREFKVEARDFRDVEEAVAQRQMLDLVPDQKQKEDIKKAEEKLAADRDKRDHDPELKKIRDQIKKLMPDKVKSEARAQSLKAAYDSKVSLYNIAVEKRDAIPSSSPAFQTQAAQAQDLSHQVNTLKDELGKTQAEADQVNKKINDLTKQLKVVDDVVSADEDHLKTLTADFERFAKLAAQKRWRFGDAFRRLPVIDAFATPTKIQQFTLNELPIDYNFKYVTRFDRCTTCHLGIDRRAFSKDILRDLTKDPPKELKDKLASAIDMLKERKKILKDDKDPLGPGDLRLTTLSKAELTESRVNEYCAHPRLDLFVDGNSPHPAEKFGCTICHSGQGSATDFALASHTPNDEAAKKRWTTEGSWESNHFWDFPMLPSRFLESSCLKCHHQVVDLLPHGKQTEKREGREVDSPGAKVVRGYNLVRENGCFGCHEISGVKGGREVGPDLRTEPNPPLEAMAPGERARMLADPLNLPGTQRKVGPSLRRITEKTNQIWARKWLLSPRDFRPDTRMPHFYGLSNNDPNRKDSNQEMVLPDDQKEFPNAEIHSIIAYLFKESQDYLQGKDKYRRGLLGRKQELLDKQKTSLISEPESRELEEIDRRLELAGTPIPLRERMVGESGTVVSLPAMPQEAKAQQDQINTGRRLFTERGCLACHSHQGTAAVQGQSNGKDELQADFFPPVSSEANFGPNLTRVAAKIIPENGDPDGKRRWLTQWVMNPTIHSPRTKMPITHLTPEEASNVAAWLLSQPVDGWQEPDVPEPSPEKLEQLARIYLGKAPALAPEEVNEIFQPVEGGKYRGLSPERIKSLPWEADERELAGPVDTTQVKWYIGKKSIGRFGCFGCHDVPGFEFAKPTGTPLNDWGKKDAERLAFEDVVAFVKDNYHIVDKSADKAVVDGKLPYEHFFFEALENHQREGFLNQKLRDPRSYDYHRRRPWEERLMMPQFRFARTLQKPDESVEDFKVRQELEEAEAREAVMTFILGLVADPIPFQFVNNPTSERLAEIKGLHVLDKFNCAGCHQLRSGIYQYNIYKPSPILETLEGAFKEATDPSSNSPVANTYRADFRFENHNAWTGRPSSFPDLLMAHAIPTEKDERLVNFALDPARNENALSIRLTEALRFTKKPEDVRDVSDAEELPPGTYDLPASQVLTLPKDQLVSRSDPHGGTFTELLVPYLIQRKTPSLNDNANARAGLPPPLLREGEKTQPGWLFQFLRNPTKIREVTILRMPRFNMSDEDAINLVNYFGAVDKQSNPGIGLNVPYLSIPERDDEFLARKTEEYSQRGAEDGLKNRNYLGDSYHLLTNKDLCMKCHQVGDLPMKDKPVGPRLVLSQERLRPEWTQRWIASPQRLLVFPIGQHPMPQMFEANNPRFKDVFDGLSTKRLNDAQKHLQDALAKVKATREAEANAKETDKKEEAEQARRQAGKEYADALKEVGQFSLNQAIAARDILMNFNKVANMPENREPRPAEGGK